MKKAEKRVPVTPETRHKELTVTAIRLAVRKQPSISSDIVRTVTQGETLEQIGDDDGVWTRVKGGYVMSEFVTPKG